ncbi:NADP-dependent phosphogluconate dehydrogenase [Rufibacter glacialis]|uniref:6-phosphogluconate dehydrogenase, decarboxylating n=1 Tax=Rufibacter glacialis TaxID=1259555 RepID=A0A5M8QI93_9BACT|nr:NADP-dependent phosphogluconate dehydrogenase [Rufibacter glacialis]KAA6434821.1 NADP-dependent phosphogluconate dehydrogenase [Rufibacter glacialis]GGK72735.1 6-phosphogluconate dehydrogenase, NADP(+)-dependent, decarboxylating [Rufibacter glacialis]
MEYDFGIVGLGVMGRNLLLNIADHGFSAVGLDLDPAKAAAFEAEATLGTTVKGTTSIEEFVASLQKPRAVMLLVPAGKAVDAALASLTPLLEPGDIVIDGGNSYFPDTDRRVLALREMNLHFFGMGISGGEKGARFGPSMMPGGDRQAYERLRPVFEAVAAKVDGEPCVTYLGNGSAGNYVKMVHNGIEYGIMQLLAETYDLLKRGLGYSDEALQQLFQSWNTTEVQSFLVEITGQILAKKDDLTGQRLVSMISDWARQKGTGKWTSQNAMDLQVPLPCVDMAVTMRDMSAYKQERILAAQQLAGVFAPTNAAENDPLFEKQLLNAFYFAMLVTYAQGLVQLRVASHTYQYDLQLAEVAKIWRGGCIIRAACLEDIRQAFATSPDLPNLLLDAAIGQDLVRRQQDLRAVVKTAIDKGIPVPGMMASLAYFDAYRSETLPTNLIQAQRDYFGAHTYERIDQPGVFHTQWN